MPDNYNTVNGHISKSQLSAKEAHDYYSFQQIHSCADELKKYNDDIHARDRTNASILEKEIRERNNTEAISIMASVEPTKHNQGEMFKLTQRIEVLSDCLQDELIPVCAAAFPKRICVLSDISGNPSGSAIPVEQISCRPEQDSQTGRDQELFCVYTIKLKRRRQQVSGD